LKRRRSNSPLFFIKMTDINANIPQMKIIEAANLPEGEKVYLTKGKFGYRIVHPIKNEDGSTNYINLLVGGWANFIKIVFIIAVILLFLYGVKQMMISCNNMAAHPEQYFDGCYNESNVLNISLIDRGFEVGDIDGGG